MKLIAILVLLWQLPGRGDTHQLGQYPFGNDFMVPLSLPRKTEKTYFLYVHKVLDLKAHFTCEQFFQNGTKSREKWDVTGGISHSFRISVGKDEVQRDQLAIVRMLSGSYFSLCVMIDTQTDNLHPLSSYVARPSKYFDTKYLIQLFRGSTAIVFAKMSPFSLHLSDPDSWAQRQLDLDSKICSCHVIELTCKAPETMEGDQEPYTNLTASVPVGIVTNVKPMSLEGASVPTHIWGKSYVIALMEVNRGHVKMTTKVSHPVTVNVLGTQKYAIRRNEAAQIHPFVCKTPKTRICILGLVATDSIVVEVFNNDTLGIYFTPIPPIESFGGAIIEYRYGAKVNPRNLKAKAFLITSTVCLNFFRVDKQSYKNLQKVTRGIAIKSNAYRILAWDLDTDIKEHRVECLIHNRRCYFLFYILSTVEGPWRSFMFFNFETTPTIMSELRPNKTHESRLRENGTTLNKPWGPLLKRPNGTIKACRKNQTVPGDGYDNDCDGKVDEEKDDGSDDDSDGLIDEDLSRPSPVNGGWTEWTIWTCYVSRCSESWGRHSRKRYCDNPMAEYGGRKCPGFAVDRSTSVCRGVGLCYWECPDGVYGWNCSQKCPDQCRNYKCSKLWGDCEGCNRGYERTEKCNHECHIRFHGINCSQLCPQKCLETCDYRTGACNKVHAKETQISRETMYIVFGLSLLLIMPTVIFVIVYRRYCQSEDEQEEVVESESVSSDKS